MTVTREFVIQKGKLAPELADSLLAGVTKEELEILIIKASLSESLTKQVLDIKRMNLIGGLRAEGFQITGGRRGGKVYQVVDWVEPTGPEKTTEDFDDDQRSRLQQLESLQVLTIDQKSIDAALPILTSGRPDLHLLAHERSLMSILCYDVSGNDAYIYRGHGGDALIVRRFKRTPSFKVIPLTMDYVECFNLIEWLMPISFKPPKLLYIPDAWVAHLKDDWPGVVIDKATEAIYDVERFATRPKTLWHGDDDRKRRKQDELTRFVQLEWGGETLAGTIIEEWRKVNEVKQRQLAIRRDYHSVIIQIPTKKTFIGLRENLPVCLSVVDKIGPDVYAEITEKSLNYASQPGGRSGTTDYTLWKTCVMLHEEGIRWLSYGHIHGGEAGLTQKKTRMAEQLITVASATFPLEGGSS